MFVKILKQLKIIKLVIMRLRSFPGSWENLSQSRLTRDFGQPRTGVGNMGVYTNGKVGMSVNEFASKHEIKM